MLLLPVSGSWYAVDLARMRQVLAGSRPTPLPTAPAELLGLVNLRGALVPVFDTAVLLDVGRVAATHVAVASVAGPAGQALAGLAVDGVPQTAWLGPPSGAAEGPGAVSLHRAPPGLRTAASAGAGAGGAGGAGGGAVVLLDLDALLRARER